MPIDEHGTGSFPVTVTWKPNHSGCPKILSAKHYKISDVDEILSGCCILST